MVHIPPCRSTEDHLTAIVAEREWPSLTDLLDRWDHDREEEMRLAALEEQPDAHLDDWSPGELMEAFGS
jgi:hypothetical protein